MDLYFSPTTDDLVVENGDLVLATQSQAIAQAIRIALRTWLREWFLDIREGTDYPGRIFGRSDPVLRDAEIKRVILSVPGVEEILTYRAAIEATRVLEVSGTVRTVLGTEPFLVTAGVEVLDADFISFDPTLTSAGPHELEIEGLQGSVVQGVVLQSTGPHELEIEGLTGDVVATVPNAVLDSAGPHELEVEGLQGEIVATSPDAVLDSAGPHELEIEGLQGVVVGDALLDSAGAHELEVEGLQGSATADAVLDSGGPHELEVEGLQGDVTAEVALTGPAADILGLGPTHFWLLDRPEYDGTTILWQDSAQTTAVASASDPIGSAVCLVTGEVLEQTFGGTFRPVWDGSKAVFAAANSQFWLCDLGADFGPSEGAFTIATRHQIDGSEQRLLSTNSATYSDFVAIGADAGDHFLNTGSGLDVADVAFDNGVERRWIAQCGVTAEVWKDGTSVVTGNSGTSTLRDFAIGRSGPGASSRYLNGNLTALVFFDKNLSSGERTTLDDALAALGA